MTEYEEWCDELRRGPQRTPWGLIAFAAAWTVVWGVAVIAAAVYGHSTLWPGVMLVGAVVASLAAWRVLR